MNRNVNVLRTGIAWSSDKKLKFSNPLECSKERGANHQECLKNAFKNYAKPRDWKKNLWQLDPLNSDNNGLENEDLIVWMRTAAFPNFRKPYRKINHNDPENMELSRHFKEGIPKGSYTLHIEYNFEVAKFSGGKAVVLSTVSFLGGKNFFLGIMYVIVGCVCSLLGIVLFMHHHFNGQLGSLKNMTLTRNSQFYEHDDLINNVSSPEKKKHVYMFQDEQQLHSA